MAEQMLSARVTRAARKRVAATAAAAAAAVDHTPVTKKRAVLGELPNLSNIAPPTEPIEPQKPLNLRAKGKGKVRKGTKKSAVSCKLESPQPRKKEDGDRGIDVRTDEDDPQMCREYAADIYEYLRKMEVIVLSSYASWVND